jgi:AraC-like DNA-binding protein
MSVIYEERLSDSPYVELVQHGWTVSNSSTIRPAESHWHMVFVKYKGQTQTFVVGPLTTSGVTNFIEGAEILWLKFKLGTFLPQFPLKTILNIETLLPNATSQSFWLKGSAWQFPDFENIDTFVQRLVRQELLVRDPVVNAALQDQPQEIASRTVRHRFLQATGLTQTHIRQIERAQQAAALLRQGLSILDTVQEAGYYDQPHLTRSLKLWTGHTPAQLISALKS